MNDLPVKIDAVVMVSEKIHAEQAIEGCLRILNFDDVHCGILPGVGAYFEGSEADLVGGDQLAARKT